MTNTYANFYPCKAGVFSHDDWVCGDPYQPSFNFCVSGPPFTFNPGNPFVPDFTIESTSNTTSNATCSDHSCHQAKLTVGLGVGLSLGVAMLAIAVVLGYLLYRERNQQKETRIDLEKEKKLNNELQNRSWAQPVWQSQFRAQPVLEADSSPYTPEMEGR